METKDNRITNRLVREGKLPKSELETYPQKRQMKNTLSKGVNALKSKVIDKTSDVLSAPSRAISDSKSRGYSDLYRRMKNVNDTPASVNDGGPNKGNPSQLFKNRTEMQYRKSEQMKALKKKQPEVI